MLGQCFIFSLLRVYHLTCTYDLWFDSYSWTELVPLKSYHIARHTSQFIASHFHPGWTFLKGLHSLHHMSLAGAQVSSAGAFVHMRVRPWHWQVPQRRTAEIMVPCWLMISFLHLDRINVTQEEDITCAGSSAVWIKDFTVLLQRFAGLFSSFPG